MCNLIRQITDQTLSHAQGFCAVTLAARIECAGISKITKLSRMSVIAVYSRLMVG